MYHGFGILIRSPYRTQKVKNEKTGFLKNTEILGTDFFICWTLHISALLSLKKILKKWWAHHFIWPAGFWAEMTAWPENVRNSKKNFSEVGPYYKDIMPKIRNFSQTYHFQSSKPFRNGPKIPHFSPKTYMCPYSPVQAPRSLLLALGTSPR